MSRAAAGATSRTHAAMSAGIPVMAEKTAPASSAPANSTAATPAMAPDGRFTGQGVAGLHFERRWTTPGIHPYDQVE